MDLSTVAAAIAAPIVLALLNRAAKRKPAIVDGRPVVAHGAGFKGIAVIAVLMALAPVAGIFVALPEYRLGWVLISLLAGAFAYCAVAEAFFARVSWTDDGIEARSAWNGTRVVPWSEVVGKDFSALAQWHRIHTARSGFIRVHQMQIGADTFIAELKARGVQDFDRVPWRRPR